jgi:hypothetical protein
MHGSQRRRRQQPWPERSACGVSAAARLCGIAAACCLYVGLCAAGSVYSLATSVPPQVLWPQCAVLCCAVM